jgi:hypothetical protein
MDFWIFTLVTNVGDGSPKAFPDARQWSKEQTYCVKYYWELVIVGYLL